MQHAFCDILFLTLVFCGDPAAAQNQVAGIEDGQLAGGGGAGGLMELNLHAALRGGQGGWGLCFGITKANGAFCGGGGRFHADPVEAGAKSTVHIKIRSVGQDHLVCLRPDGRDEKTVSGGDPQAAALAQGIVVDAPVRPQYLPRAVHKIAGRRSWTPPVQPGGVVPVGDEADLHAVRLFRHRKAALAGELPYLGLFILPKGNTVRRRMPGVSRASM